MSVVIIFGLFVIAMMFFTWLLGLDGWMDIGNIKDEIFDLFKKRD